MTHKHNSVQYGTLQYQGLNLNCLKKGKDKHVIEERSKTRKTQFLVCLSALSHFSGKYLDERKRYAEWIRPEKSKFGSVKILLT
jgi:hypothetical protein